MKANLPIYAVLGLLMLTGCGNDETTQNTSAGTATAGNAAEEVTAERYRRADEKELQASEAELNLMFEREAQQASTQTNPVKSETFKPDNKYADEDPEIRKARMLMDAYSNQRKPKPSALEDDAW